MAQADGSTVVAAAGAVLHRLQLDPATGALAAGPSCDLPQQASALGAFTLPAAALAAGGISISSTSSSSSGGGSRSYVGVGLWLDNSVLVLQQGSLATAAQVHLGEQQPRSVAAAVLNGCAMLFVGTSAGQVSGGTGGMTSSGAMVQWHCRHAGSCTRAGGVIVVCQRHALCRPQASAGMRGALMPAAASAA
jgi:hypothetical protein